MSSKKKSKQIKNSGKNKLLLILTGLSAGICNGLFGGGGGMIVVPMLTYVLKKEPKHSHATAILIILPMAIISGLLYTLFGEFEIHIGIPTSIGVVIGGIVGALLLKKISNKITMLIFAVVILLAGVKMLFF